MSFLSRIFSAPAQKSSKGWALHFTGLSPVAWMKQDYSAYAREAYQMNVIGYSAINRIANAVASIEWEVKTRSGERTTDHPFLRLLRRPNPQQSGAEWWRTRISYLLISGNLYDERVDGANGKPAELWPLRPDRMTIQKGRYGMPLGYIYKVGQNEERFPADPITGESAIRHTKLFNPLDDWYGMSPIQASTYPVDQHNESMTWIQALLQNSARPSGALVVDKEVSLSDEEFYRVKGQIEEQYSGSANAGRPLLLEGGMDWKEMGLSPQDMDILRTKESAARDISLAFGVPPLLLNIPGDNTYANYREARLGFYEDTILPFLKYQVEELNDWLADEFDGAQLRPNVDKIEAIADKRTKMWEMADNSDDLTLNESRAMKGLPPIDGPRGEMLMVEIRAAQKQKETPESEEDTIKLLKELSYGNA